MPPLPVRQLREQLEVLERWRASDGSTTLISLYLAPRPGTLVRARQMLVDEAGVAVNIKQARTRRGVGEALRALQQRLRDVNSLPETGLALFCGDGDASGRAQLVEIEPPRALVHTHYMCDRALELGQLREMLTSDPEFGVVVVTGTECVYGIVAGTESRVLGTRHVVLPNKQGCGGQSAPRFQHERI